MLVYPRVYQTGIVAESYTIWPKKKRSDGIIENAGISQQNLMFNQHDGAPKIASSYLISVWILWFMVDITIVNGGYKATYS